MTTQTCGQGLVQNSSLPLSLAEVTAALAENLERHLPSIDPAEPEHAVYAELVDRLKPAADELRAAGELMAAQAELPMADHDMTKLAAPAGEVGLGPHPVDPGTCPTAATGSSAVADQPVRGDSVLHVPPRAGQVAQGAR